MTTYRNFLIYFTVFGMEMSWLYASLNAANKSVTDRLSIPLLLVTFLISYAISKSLRYLHWPKPALTTISWFIWPVMMLLMIKVQLFRDISLGDTVWLASVPHAFTQILYRFEPSLLIQSARPFYGGWDGAWPTSKQTLPLPSQNPNWG